MKKILLLLSVVAGVLAGAGAMPDGVCSAENLIHRWSFATDAVDAIGGTTGTVYGTASVASGQLTLRGGSQNSSYANLGTGLVPTNGPFTIELWAKKTATSYYGRIFDIGVNNSNYIFMAWSVSRQENTDRIGYYYKLGANYTKDIDNTMQYALDTFYHIAISYTPLEDNSTLIAWSRRNLKTGALERISSVTSHVGWTTSLLPTNAPFYLGHSQWPGEADSASVYEEVRVWNTTLTEDQIAWSARLGPDVLPTTAMDDPAQTASLNATSDGEGGVRINGGGASVSTNHTEILSAFTTNTLTAVAKTGYRFKEWTGDTDAIVDGSTMRETVQVLSGRAIALNATYQYAISTWSGLAGDGLWTTAGNWKDFVPNEGSEIVFGASDSTTTENNAIGSASRVSFLEEAPAYTITGNALSLDTLVNASTATQTFNVAVSSPSGLTMDNAGTVTFGEVFNGPGITATGAGKTVLAKGFATGNAKTLFSLTGQSSEISGESTGYGLYVMGNNAHATVTPGSTLTFTVDDNSILDVGRTGSTAPVLDLNDATVATGHFTAGRNVTGTINQNGGEVTCRRWFVSGVSSGGVGTFNLNGGTFRGTLKNESNPPFIVGEASGAKGTVNITGASTLSTAGSADVGKSGTGTVNQSDGTVTIGAGLLIGRNASGVGTYNLTGGEVNVTNGVTYMSPRGTGTLNVSKTGVYRTGSVTYANNTAAANGVVNVFDGGVLEATGFVTTYRGARAELNVDGGTVRVRGAKQSYTSFFNGLSDIHVGAGGMILDTGDNTVALNEAILSKKSAGTITKTGEGTLYLPTTSAPVGGLKVDEGLVITANAIPLQTTAGTKAATVPHLLHRWRFNDATLKDEVTGQSAIAAGSFSYTNGCLRLPGGKPGTGYVDLGADLLPTDGRAFTIEIFATPLSIQYWARMFSVGAKANATKNTAFLSWSRGSSKDTDRIEIVSNGKTVLGQNDKFKYAVNTPYHITFVCQPNVCGNGGMKVTVTCEKLDGTQTYGGEYNLANPASVAAMNAERFWLGHSPTGNDNDANADYDEVRIWDVAITPEQARRNAVLGADTLPKFEGGLVHRWSFNGDYTDSVGGQTATVGGSNADQVAWDDAENPTAVKLPGLGSNTAYISLGQGVVPSAGDAVTIELWATKISAKGWARLFELGTGTSKDYIYMCHQNNGGRVEYKVNNTIEIQKDNTMTYDVGKRYHVAMTIVRNADGKTTLKWSSRDDAGTVKGSGTATSKNAVSLDTLFFGKAPFYLGHTSYTSWKDPDANSSYDEVRIWRGALSDAQLVANAQLGPDTLPATVDYVETAGDASAVANLDLGADGTFQWQAPLTVETVAGTGSLTGIGTLTVGTALDIAGTGTGRLRLDGALAVTGAWTIDAAGATSDSVVGTGSIDLSQATIEIRDPSQLTADCYVLASGPAVTGVTPRNLHGYMLSAKKNRLVLIRPKLAIFIR